ncbi:MAG: aminotransferase class I/II-fold pyridoxal phosphate-dependent enzyme, partial [Anaerolineaceae bacterium]|nr:aminotransferase class I/II-fold pyridoxal phosphate-dependent enzyme [Anaerolineaceae bacterium]
TLLGTMAPLYTLINSVDFNARATDPLACDFALGDPHDMPLPGLVDALRRQLTPQNPAWFAYKNSEPASRKAVAAYLKDWRGVSYAPEDIFLTNGAFAGLNLTLRVLVDPGDEVIFISPPWFFYEAMIAATGGAPMRVSIQPQTFDLDLGAIEAAITPRTRAIIINTPNNPTGKIYPRDTLQGLAHILNNAMAKAGRPVYLISDEAYSRIVYDGRPFFSPTREYPYSFLVYTYGKQLLAPGERIGFIALPPEAPSREELRAAIMMAQFVNGYAWPNALLQYALPELNKLSVDIGQLQRRRDRMVSQLHAIGYALHSPEGTFYLLPQSPWQDDIAFCRLLAQQHVYCLPGTVMEMPGYFRISLTASDDMVERSLEGFRQAMELAKTSSPETVQL